jgi:hypothetical protein
LSNAAKEKGVGAALIERNPDAFVVPATAVGCGSRFS